MQTGNNSRPLPYTARGPEAMTTKQRHTCSMRRCEWVVVSLGVCGQVSKAETSFKILDKVACCASCTCRATLNTITTSAKRHTVRSTHTSTNSDVVAVRAMATHQELTVLCAGRRDSLCKLLSQRHAVLNHKRHAFTEGVHASAQLAHLTTPSSLR